MGYSSFLRSPKKEEQQVPDASASEFDDIKGSYGHGEIDIIDDLDGNLGVENDEMSGNRIHGHLNWDFMDWERAFQHADEEDEGEHKVYTSSNYFEEESEYKQAVKTEQLGFWELEDEKRASLNLNLNYQDVLDAWSDRGPLWADHYSTPTNVNGYYMGEVPMMELEERTRREASVLRYKEKRQSRLFCKKIRYQVRKLNADKRPRLKGRFVKRVS